VSRPEAKRPHETHWQWHSRIALLRQQERDRDQPLVTPEAMRQAQYDDEFVMHVETGTKVQTKRRRQKSSLEALRDRGQLTQDQLNAAQQIARVAESIRRHVSVRCASLEARVDCSGSSHNMLIEHINQVRLERAFSAWRIGIRVPRQLVVDMIVADCSLKATARQHNVGWPRAFRMLESALDLWIKLSFEAGRNIDQQDVDAAHRRLAA
jgi:hypothetical protein